MHLCSRSIIPIQSMQNTNFIKGAILTIASLIVVSCAKNELFTESQLSSTAINFSKESDEYTLLGTTTPLDDFIVFGYYTGSQSIQDLLNQGKQPVANWMYKQLVQRTPEGSYTYTPIHYWPLNANDKISFVSYAPATSKSIHVITPNATTKAGAPVFQYTTNIDSPTEDFLVSRPAFDLTRQESSVKFLMQHVLSRLLFNIKSTTSGVRIKSIHLKNVYTKATYSVLGRSWTGISDKKDLCTYTMSESEQTLSDQFKILPQHYIVIPQETSTSTVPPTLTFVFDDNGIEKQFDHIPSNEWMVYKSYTFNITYSGRELVVQTNTEPWIENDVIDNILANQYLNVSTREVDLTESHHFYYNSSFPSTSIGEKAIYPDKSIFHLYDYFNIYYEGNKIRLQAREDQAFEAESFTIYLQGLDLHGHIIVRLPIRVKTEKDGDIEIDGTFWAPGNIISHNGSLDIAPNANYTGLYFRWGSLIGLAGNNAKSFQFIADKTIGFRPYEYTANITKWDQVPYEQTMKGQAYPDAFAGRYDNTLGFDAAKALGDPCRYMSHQKGWTKGKWRMPTKAEYEAIIVTRKIRKINGTWGIADETHEHLTATTGTLPVEAGWFVKTDITDNTIPPDDAFNSVKPPVGWVFYPAAGERGGYTGILSQYSTGGYYWTATTVSWDAAYRFQFSNKNTGNNAGSFSDIASGFVGAFPIRCVRDTTK